MPILYTGTTLPLAVAAGQSLVIKELTGTATVTGSVTSREDASSSIGAGFVVYGPQPSAVSLSMTTTGLCEWQIVNGDATPAKGVLRVTTDPLTGLDVLDAGSKVAVQSFRRATLPSRAAALLGAPVTISAGRANVGIDPKSLVPLDPKVSATVYYVDVTNGNDTNNGTTWALAVKSIWKAVTLGNTAAVPYTVNIAPGTYFRANGFSNNGTEVIPTQSCLIQGANGQAICVSGDSHTWTLESGTTYQVTRSNAKRVFDMSEVDDDGDFYEFTLAASLAACQATPGSWYTDNTTTYVNRLDGAAATAANTMVILQAINTIRATTSGNMHMYRITQYGGNSGCIKISGNATGKFYAEDCAFKYSATSTYIDNVQSLDYALCVFNRCIASKAQKDGFNFHIANSVIPAAILFDCKGYGNGTATASTSNNGVTIHDAGVLIDFNGRYWGNYGGDFAHANAGTMAVGVCTHTGGSPGDESRGGAVPAGTGFHSVDSAAIYKYDCVGEDLITGAGSITVS